MVRKTQPSRPDTDDSTSGTRTTVDKEDGMRVLYEAFEGLRVRIEQLESTMNERLSLRTPKTPSVMQAWRGGSPLGDLSVETTEHGHTRLPPGMLEEVTRRLGAIDAERGKAEAYAHGQKAAYDSLLKWLKWGLGDAMAIGTAVGFVVRHLLPH